MLYYKMNIPVIMLAVQDTNSRGIKLIKMQIFF